ncbi:hypothetical protein [Robertmurraya siralis]|uniref:hypothetical protein n=1 Tax=Robertmurraya siralis TaxID=77777 RepID=UPI0010F80B16|nr:hypothetical protein [Robertmurraya siralis]
MKTKITFITLLLISIISIYTTFEANNNKVDTVQEKFEITSISEGVYQATNIKPNIDKNELYFTLDDIQDDTSITEGDTVTAHYIEAGTEDIFFKVTK